MIASANLLRKLPLEGRVALVTGGGRGVGAGVSRVLASRAGNLYRWRAGWPTNGTATAGPRLTET
jgi:NAD(P)-dependent dehydrogenase (short-subunit alcohol dehydrogenase family)